MSDNSNDTMWIGSMTGFPVPDGWDILETNKNGVRCRRRQTTTPPGTGWRLWTEEAPDIASDLIDLWRSDGWTAQITVSLARKLLDHTGMWWRLPIPAPEEEQWEVTWISPPPSFPALVPRGWTPCGGDRTGILCRRRVRPLSVAPGRGTEGV